MDKKAWIAISLSIIGILAHQWYYNRELAKSLPATPPPPVQASAAPGATNVPVVSAATPTEPATATPTAPKIEAAPVQVPVQLEKTTNASLERTYTNHGGGIAETTLAGARNLNATGSQLELNRLGGVPIGALSEKPADVAAAAAPYEMRRDGAAVVFERTTSEGLRITKRFAPPAAVGTTAPDPYVTDLEITFTNTGATAYRDDGLFLHTGAATPLHSRDLASYTQFDWHRDGKTVMKDVTFFDGSKFLGLFQSNPPSAVYTDVTDQISWASVNNQFYTTVLSVLPAAANAQLPTRSVWAVRFPIPPPEDVKAAPAATPGKAPIYGITGAIGLTPLKLAPGESQTMRFQIYTGPKEYNRLNALGNGMADILNFGMFKIFSVFLLSSMNFIYRFVGNYALAIIILTCLIKAALWPLQSKAIREMKKMSLLGPKMAELKEKLKDDPQKLNQAMWQLQREYGVNPMGGCLPTLAQMPIFFGFYSMLGTAVELRGSSFLWIKDLSVPDTVTTLALMGYSLPLNPLPLIMAATMFWQMQITPKTGDQQQQKIFMFMPFIFIIFCYNFASALALYWTVQNLLSVLQTYLTRHRPLPALTKVNTGEKAAKAQVVSSNQKKKALR
jgi:YidC/Oxa1 family membrane protein insertase